MTEFFDWDRAEQSASGLGDMPLGSGGTLDFRLVQDDDSDVHDFDLALANLDGDDFGFWALENFDTTNLTPNPVSTLPNDLQLSESEQKPCDACEASGFNCKTINKDKCNASCTTRVSLNINGSFSSGEDANNGAPGLSPPAEWRSGAEHTTDDGQLYDPRSSSSPVNANLSASAGIESGNDNGVDPPVLPKIGARFSRESVRILKAWLSVHNNRPYPNDEERENLIRQTGLNKTQISNWLANARRRSKQKIHRPTRAASPSVRTWAGAVEIPPRRGVSGDDAEFLSPLQRWQNSPPENEPASVTAIASAILQSDPSNYYGPGINSPFNITDEDLAPSSRASSASSFGTSPSSGSFASAFSQGSRSSVGSLQQRGRRRRRRRAAPKEANKKVGLSARQFQCTFCTETFRTKHDWQRHEKSLHLSLEQWICCPRGPRALNPDNNQVCCVLCGITDPDNAHIESHNYTSCQERSLDERTFYRKDHLRQHMKLVHNTKYTAWAMDSWKASTPDIRSHCGFCGIVLNSWPVRVDHLAEHFKSGSEMRDWKGDWGFEPAVFSMIENAIPPYMIHDERATPLPFQASQTNSESPRSAYELIKLELSYWLKDRMKMMEVSDDDYMLEACRIIYASEVLSKSEHPPPSWLRALLMSSDEISRQARMGPIRTQAESCLRHLRVNGKDNMFEDCPLEEQLADFVKAQTILGLTASDEELRVEACKIVVRMEECSNLPMDHIANFYLRLIYSKASWLSSFRQRAGLSPVDELGSLAPATGSANASIQLYSQLDPELADFANNHRATTGAYPSDDELRRQASCVVYQCQDDNKQTAANNTAWLTAFKQRHFERDNQIDSTKPPASHANPFFSSESKIPSILNQPNTSKQIHYFLNASCYRRLAWDLDRFVTAAMSPNNPNRHVPTDEELKHQARCILYDDDDPFNHTAADNAEWLLRFKRSVGLLPAEEGDCLTEYMLKEGLRRTKPWPDSHSPLPDPSSEAVSLPASCTQPMQIDSHISLRDLTFSPSIGPTNVHPTPPTTATTGGMVFANRDFEDKLVQFAVSEVASSGRLPPDAAIQARAKELSGFEVWQAELTPVDDPVLLAQFKAMVVDKVKAVLGDDPDEASRPPWRTVAPALLPLDSPPAKRGLDVIDPGLLPALGSGVGIGVAAETPTTADVACSESRLGEFISEALQR